MWLDSFFTQPLQRAQKRRLFFDIDNYKPLSFYKEKVKNTPKQIGGALKAWVILEEAKALQWKRLQQVGISLVLIAAIVIIHISSDFLLLIDSTSPSIFTFSPSKSV